MIQQQDHRWISSALIKSTAAGHFSVSLHHHHDTSSAVCRLSETLFTLLQPWMHSKSVQNEILHTCCHAACMLKSLIWSVDVVRVLHLKIFWPVLTSTINRIWKQVLTDEHHSSLSSIYPWIISIIQPKGLKASIFCLSVWFSVRNTPDWRHRSVCFCTQVFTSMKRTWVCLKARVWMEWKQSSLICGNEALLMKYN